MKAMFAGFVAIAVISVAAWFALGQAELSSQNANAGGNVRLD